MANLEPAERAAALILRIGSAARQVYACTGDDIILDDDVANQILPILLEHLAPGTLYASCQEVVRFLHFRKAAGLGNFFGPV